MTAFTIIGPGEEDIDKAGPAFIDDPDLGFNSLRNFGPLLIHKTQLKVRSNTNVADFIIVDSPGMIDSPVKANASPEGEEYGPRVRLRGCMSMVW